MIAPRIPLQSWDDDPWDVFLADDDGEPEPEPGDFWPDDPQLPFNDGFIRSPFAARLRRGGGECFR